MGTKKGQRRKTARRAYEPRTRPRWVQVPNILFGLNRGEEKWVPTGEMRLFNVFKRPTVFYRYRRKN